MTTAQINQQLAALDYVRAKIKTKKQARKFLIDAGIIKTKKKNNNLFNVKTIKLSFMKQIKVIIEQASDGFYSAYATNVRGITGGGETLEAVMKDIEDCIDIVKEFNDMNRPKILDGEYEIIWELDPETIKA